MGEGIVRSESLFVASVGYRSASREGVHLGLKDAEDAYRSRVEPEGEACERRVDGMARRWVPDHGCEMDSAMVISS